MSLLTLSRSLSKFVSNPKNFTKSNFSSTKKHLKTFEFLSTYASLKYSLKITKLIAYKCNHKYLKDKGLKLSTAEDLLESWIKSAKLNSIKIPESIIKLLIITTINQSFAYQESKPVRSIESIIKATKLSEHFPLKSYRGRLLKFIAKLRECELFIYMEKYDSAILCAEQMLKEVMIKLQKPGNNKKQLQELGMAAVTAFYRIGICEQSRGLQKSAEIAFENANLIGRQYLNKDKILLNLDYEMITHRKLYVENAYKKPKSWKKPVETRFDRISSPNKKETEQSEKLSEKKSNYSRKDTRSMSIGNIEEKLPGRYYSKSQLEKLSKILTHEINHKVLTTDNYFFNMISKDLDIEKLETSPVGVNNATKDLIQEIKNNKECMKKKKKVMVSSQRYSGDQDWIERKLRNMQDAFEDKLKVQDIKMKSKLKTKVYRQLLRSINVTSKGKVRQIPVQRLVFRPPDKERAHIIDSVKRVTSEKPMGLRTARLEEINQEIEEQLDDLKLEINGKGNKKAQNISLPSSPNELAKSIMNPALNSSRISYNSIIGKVYTGRSILKNSTR